MKKPFAAAALLLLSVTLSAKPEADHLGPMQGFPPDPPAEEGGKPRRHAYQGMDIYGDYMLSLQHEGYATVYRLSGDSFTKAGQFRLGSFHPYNHANVASFGVEKAQKGDPMPVVYVSHCHKKPAAEGKDVCYVERIAPDLRSSEVVQVIHYEDVNQDFGYALQWVVDPKAKMLYGYGNTIDNSHPDNRHRIIKFRLPQLSDGAMVVLHPEDALENYLIEEVSDFRFNPIGQGLYVRGGKLYMPTGIGTGPKPSILYIWDLKKKRMQVADLTECTSGELEDIAFYKGKCWIQGQDGIFRIRKF